MLKASKKYVAIVYLPIFLLTVIILIILNLILLPFAYLFNIIFIFKKWINDKVNINYLFTWVVIGVFYLLKSIFLETIDLCLYMYKNSTDFE